MKRAKLTLSCLGLIASSLYVLAPAPAAAALTTVVVQVDDLTDAISLEIIVNGVARPLVNFSGESFSPSPFAVALPNNLGVADGTIFGQANFLESPNGTVSDTIIVSGVGNTQGGTTLVMTFFSDTDGGQPLTAIDGAQNIVEDGTFQHLTLFTNDSATVDIQVRSDVESASVPEPASLTLFGFGLAGVAVYGWRRRKVPGAA